MVNKTRDVNISFKGAPEPELVTNLGGTVKRIFNMVGVISANIPENAIDKLKKNPNIEAVEIDERLFAHIPIGTCQEIKATGQIVPWGVNRIGARTVQETLGNMGEGIKISVADTGVDYTHEDIKNNCMQGYNFVDENNKPMDDNSHGSHVAGTIAAEDNDIGVVGVAPKSKIYPVKVLDYAAGGSASDILAGVIWSIENKMDIINMSLGSSEDSVAVKRGATEAYKRGIIVVAAAGNSGNSQGSGDSIDDPARYSDVVISVGATDINNKRPKFSSTGPSLEISAPGVDIPSILPRNKYGILSGTSMAAPHITGTLALIKVAHPEMTNVEARIRMQVTAQNLWKDKGYQAKSWYGYGLVDALRAVSM